MGKTLAGILALVATVATVGCGASLKDVEAEHARGGGVTRLYAAPEPRVREVVTGLLRDEGGAAAVTGAGAIEAELGATLFQQGVIVAVWTRADDAAHASVTVLTRRVGYGWGAVRFTDSGFQEALARRLASVGTRAFDAGH